MKRGSGQRRPELGSTSITKLCAQALRLTHLKTAASVATDLPPFKGSSLKYYFHRGGYVNGQEAAYGGRDRCEASAGRCVDGADLTGLFWTKLCEKLSLERSFGYAEEEIQRGANRGGASSD
jgi:hypothetical protein